MIVQWYGTQRAKFFVRTMFHVRPSLDVPLHDTLVQHGPWTRVLAAGFIGGVFIWSVPLGLYLLNLAFNVLFVWIGGASYRLSTVLGGVLPTLTTPLPYVVATGALGVGLAWMRRVSVKRRIFVDVLGMRLGLSTLVATFAGFLLSFVYFEYALFAGPFLFLFGFIVEGIWEVFHDRAVVWLCGRNHSSLLASEIREYLLRHPHLRGIQLHDVRVENGRATLFGVWPDRKVRTEVEEALRQVEGVSSVAFARGDEAPATV